MTTDTTAAAPPANYLSVSLTLSPNFSAPDLRIYNQVIEITLDLSGGSRYYESAPYIIGEYKKISTFAKLSLRYAFDKTANILTLHGKDDYSADQLTIATYLDRLADLTYRHTLHDVGLNAQASNMWADYVAKNSDLVAALKRVAAEANDAITAAALKAGVAAVRHIGHPPIVNLDNMNDFRAMYGLEAELPLEAAPTPALMTAQYQDVAKMQAIVNSTYMGTVVWNLGANFANVIGSTSDPKPPPGLSWLRLWDDKCNNGNNPNYCTSLNFFSGDPEKQCSGNFVGGHVIPGQVAERKAPGSNVYIYPICNAHNNNNNSYMEVKYNQTGVWLSYW